jgi:hypothetical protein
MDIAAAVRDFVANGKGFLHRLETDGEKLGVSELAILSDHLHELSMKVHRLKNLLLFKAQGGIEKNAHDS